MGIGCYNEFVNQDNNSFPAAEPSTEPPTPAVEPEVQQHTDPKLEEDKRQKRIEALMVERELSMQEEEKAVFVWQAPARPFKERNREYFTTIGAIVLLLSIILLFAREFLLIAVIIALSFVSYVLASVKPEEVEHQITTRGIRTGGKFFRWDQLGRFWFSSKFGQRILNVETFLGFPQQLLMLIDGDKEQGFVDKLKVYLLNETPEEGFLDRASNWLQEKVPLESS